MNSIILMNPCGMSMSCKFQTNNQYATDMYGNMSYKIEFIHTSIYMDCYKISSDMEKNHA